MIPHLIEQLAVATGKKLAQREWKLATAESCTGGGVAYAITAIDGSSSWFDRGFVTYSNAAKEDMLKVKPLTLSTFGAVSEQTVREMAEGALQHSEAQVAIAITGIAGPAGGTLEKPVGTVWFGWAGINFATQAEMKIFQGDRQEVREQSIVFSLQNLLRLMDTHP